MFLILKILRFQNRFTKVDANVIDPEEETTPNANKNTNRNDRKEKSSSPQQDLFLTQTPITSRTPTGFLYHCLNHSTAWTKLFAKVDNIIHR